MVRLLVVNLLLLNQVLLLLLVMRLRRRRTQQLMVLVVIVTVGVHNGALLVVDLLGLLVADQQQDGADEEDRRAPADAIRPSEVPVGAVGGDGVAVMKFRVEEGRIEGERDNDGQNCTKEIVEDQKIESKCWRKILSERTRKHPIFSSILPPLADICLRAGATGVTFNDRKNENRKNLRAAKLMYSAKR